MLPNIVDALDLACLIIAGGCALAVFFGLVEWILFGRSGIFDRARRRRP